MELFVGIILLIILTKIIIYLCKLLYHPVPKTPHIYKPITTGSQMFPYTEKQLLSPPEYFFFMSIKDNCQKNKIIICPKVRLEDFIIVDWKSYNLSKYDEGIYRNYIKSRHIDFLLCDEHMHVQCGIELDDSSHNSKEAKLTDTMKNNIFKAIDFPFYRVPAQIYNLNLDPNSRNHSYEYYQIVINQILNNINNNHRYFNKSKKKI